MVIAKKQKIKGVTAASMVALLQGAEGVIFTFFGLIASVALSMDRPNFSASVLVVRETIIFGVLLIIFSPKIKVVIKKIRNKGTRALFCSGFFTALGNIFYILGVATAGSSYGVILTALYPVFSLILLRILFKEKQNIKVWIGVLISVLSGLLFISLPSLIEGQSHNFGIKKLLGMVFGLAAAFFWACEGMFIKKAIDFDAPMTKTPSEQMLIRTSGSWFSTIVLVFPVSFAWGNTNHMIGTIMHSGCAMLVLLAITVNLLILRWIHLYAISNIGPKLTAIIDTNNFLIPAFFAIFLSLAPWHNVATGHELFEPFIWWIWLLVIPLFFGVFMVVYFEKNDEEIENIVLDKNV